VNILSNRVVHLEKPKQWAAMRKAEELEKKTGKKIIHFEKGDFQGDEFLPAKHIFEAAKKALDEQRVRYRPGGGIPELKEWIIKRELEEKRGIRDVDPKHIIVTPGAKYALFSSILTLVEDGDKVVFPNPGYPPDETWVKFCRGIILYTPLVGDDFRYDIDSLRKIFEKERPKLMIVNTPQRPNGEIVRNIKEIADLCLEYDVYVISDEIFSGMIYEGKHESIASIPEMRERTILIDTASKTYMMTGFRIGFAYTGNDLIAEKLDNFLQDSLTNVPDFVQVAYLEALRGSQDFVHERNEKLKRRRDYVVKRLNEMPGVRCRKPPATFYVFPDIRDTGLNSIELRDYLIENYSVAVVNGSAFGDRGEGHIRITYAAPFEILEEGLNRMEEGLRKLKFRA